MKKIKFKDIILNNNNEQIKDKNLITTLYNKIISIFNKKNKK